MIDTHCHLLANIDDGASSESETYEMSRLARADGITTIVATPHCFDGKYQIKPDLVRALSRNLTQDLRSAGIQVEVLPGMEVRIGPEIFKHLENNEILPLNEGKYILLEFHRADVPVGFENFFEKLLESGYKAALAHPEKNLAIQDAPENVYKLITMFKPWEILIQITSDSLTGASGFRAKKCAERLLKHNLAHLIASDAHSAGERVPRLSEAINRAAKIIGEEDAAQMVNQIPRAALFGATFPEKWSPENPRRWWRLF